MYIKISAMQYYTTDSVLGGTCTAVKTTLQSVEQEAMCKLYEARTGRVICKNNLFTL